LENLRNGIDHDIKEFEFNTEWDGYDSYSLRILAAGHIDTFPGKALEETLSFLQSIADEKDLENHDENENHINKFNFVLEKMQKLRELMANNKVSLKTKLKNWGNM